jgi:hypothetical protein
MAHSIISEFEARRVERFLRELYVGKLRRNEALTVSGTLDGQWLAVRWQLRNEAATLQYDVDARVDVKINKLRERDAVDLLYDLLGEQFGEFLTNREPFTGSNWEMVEFAGKQVWLRGQLVNEDAELRGSDILHADAVVRSRELAQETVTIPGDETDPAA